MSRIKLNKHTIYSGESFQWYIIPVVLNKHTTCSGGYILTVIQSFLLDININMIIVILKTNINH